MIGNLSSYSYRHFIPFTDEVYFRLFERQFEAWWLLLLFPIPLLWAATTGATLAAIEAPMPMTLPAVAVIALVAAVWKAVSSRMIRDTADAASSH